LFFLLHGCRLVNKTSLSSAKGLDNDLLFRLSFLYNLQLKCREFWYVGLLADNVLGVPLEILTEQIKA